MSFFDALLFFTTGELAWTDQQKKDFLSFIHDDGKGFIGVHTATDTFYTWPEYGEMTGGYFKEHPWGIFEAPVIVEDSKFPGIRSGICESSGSLRRFINIYVDGEDVRFLNDLATPVKDGAEIAIVPAIAGGRW